MTRPLILHCLDGLGIGGAERELVLLLAHMPQEMFEHVVCHVGPDAELDPEVRRLGIPVHDLSGGRRHSARALIRLLWLARRIRPALIHADHQYGKLCARIVSRLLGIPLLATMGLTVSGPERAPAIQKTPLRYLLALAERMGARFFTDHTIAISNTIKRGLIRMGVPAGRVSVVYRGLDLADFPPLATEDVAALRASLELTQEGPILLNVARLIRRKGQEMIIKAMPAVRRRHPRATLLLVGDGPSRAQYQQIAAEEGVADAVHFLGTRRDVPELLALADVFVFPSRREGLGVALLEGMAAGRPCVVSDLPIFREVLGEEGAGLFVPLDRPDLLAEALLGLFQDAERATAMGRRARKVVEERFNIRQNALEFARVCRRVIEAAHSGPSMEATTSTS